MEIEVKFRLTAEQEQQLLAAYPEQAGPEEKQQDIYFFTGFDGKPSLRVRSDASGACVTAKANFAETGGVRTRLELEPMISPADSDTWVRIFNLLGFPTWTVVTKMRRCIQLPGGVTLCLDTVEGAGKFIEFEILAEADKVSEASQTLNQVIAQLGFAGVPRVTQSYRELVQAS